MVSVSSEWTDKSVLSILNNRTILLPLILTKVTKRFDIKDLHSKIVNRNLFSVVILILEIG
jgi:hypothetical protein